jgi:sugar phosphate isomerase/epimerase
MTLSRRALLGSLGLSAAGAPSNHKLRYAICNETFTGSSFEDGCRIARRTGFSGLEIAPFTLGDDPAELSPARRRELRKIIAAENIEYAGAHAFLSAPKGLLLTAADSSLRARSWDYFRRMIDLCADLGDRGVMVFGSSRQRQATDGVSVAEATDRIRDGLAAVASHAGTHGVTVLLEPLAPHLCNVINSLEQCVEIVRAIDSPAIQTMFDTHNAVLEERPHGKAVRRYYRHIQHVHLNEMDGRRPGAGDYDFPHLLAVLQELRFRGWVSVEVFDFAGGGERIARESMEYLRSIERG